jgi:hypothetical protein
MDQIVLRFTISMSIQAYSQVKKSDEMCVGEDE